MNVGIKFIHALIATYIVIKFIIILCIIDTVKAEKLPTKETSLTVLLPKPSEKEFPNGNVEPDINMRKCYIHAINNNKISLSLMISVPILCAYVTWHEKIGLMHVHIKFDHILDFILTSNHT